MRVTPAFALAVMALAVVGLVGCTPPPENVRVRHPVSAPPDLEDHAPANPANRSFQIRSFHLNHVWSDDGHSQTAGVPYRAKVTIGDYEDEGTPVAELYFHDAKQEPMPPSSDPASAKRPYQIHFPMSTFEPLLNTLRNTNEPIFLYYYQGRWAVGIYSAEPVGSG